jgi:hypothetical protein
VLDTETLATLSPKRESPLRSSRPRKASPARRASKDWT